MMGLGVGLGDTAVRARRTVGGGGDTTAPGRVTDLTQLVPTSGSGGDCVIWWTSAGDDGTTGTAAHVDVRAAAAPITTEADWNAAYSVYGGWVANGTPGGTYVEQYITDPGVGTWSYWAVRYRDEVGNMGPISNSLALPWY